MDSATQNGESGLNPDCVRIDMQRGERVERCNNNTLWCEGDNVESSGGESQHNCVTVIVVATVTTGDSG